MKPVLLFLVLLLGLLFSFARSKNIEEPVNMSYDPRNRHGPHCSHCLHYHPLNCKPTTDCLANGGYCIRNNHKDDCDGLLFSRECRSPLCSCCVEATLNRDECQDTPSFCPDATSVCQDKSTGYECICIAGFQTTVCGDINECGSDPCGPNSQCQNTDGSYECICDMGYEKVNGACVSSCNAGYEKVDGNCVDINECDSGNNACLSNEDCTNVPGSYTCTNKCDSNPCGPNSHCQTTPGSYECVCDAGYEKVNGNCVDIDECDSGNDACLINEECANNPGSYTCIQRCAQGVTYLTVNGRCGKLLSGNVTFSEAMTLCSQISMYVGDISTTEAVKAYGDAFLTNVGDTAWISYVPLLSIGNCHSLTKTNSTSYVPENVSCNVKLPAAICDNVGPV